MRNTKMKKNEEKTKGEKTENDGKNKMKEKRNFFLN